MLRFLVISFCVLIFSSCSHAPIKKVVNDPLPFVTGTVLNSAVLTGGGDLTLSTFKAGPLAEENDELDNFSVMILKGVKDSLEGQKTLLHVVSGNDVHPKMVLEGYVQEYSKTGRLARMTMHPNRNLLVLTGELWLVSNGERILNFTTQKKFDPKKEKPTDVAYALGKDIGDFVATHSR
ncbi:MAG: hypothetical protein WCH62_04515 [Candidatus Omnitrophota bacterium]